MQVGQLLGRLGAREVPAKLRFLRFRIEATLQVELDLTMALVEILGVTL